MEDAAAPYYEVLVSRRGGSVWRLEQKEARLRAEVSAAMQREADALLARSCRRLADMKERVLASVDADAALSRAVNAPARKELARRARAMRCARRAARTAGAPGRAEDDDERARTLGLQLTELYAEECDADYFAKQKAMWARVRDVALAAGDATGADDARNSMWVVCRNDLVRRAVAATTHDAPTATPEASAKLVTDALWTLGVYAAGARQQRCAIALGREATSGTDPRGLLGDPFDAPLSLGTLGVVAALAGSLPFLMLSATFDLMSGVLLLLDCLAKADTQWLLTDGAELVDVADSVVMAALPAVVEAAVQLGLTVEQLVRADLPEDPHALLRATLCARRDGRRRDAGARSGFVETFFLRVPPQLEPAVQARAAAWAVPPSGEWAIVAGEGWSVGHGAPPSLAVLRRRPARTAAACAGVDRYRLTCVRIADTAGPARVRSAWVSMAQKRAALFEFGMRLAEFDASATAPYSLDEDEAAMVALMDESFPD